MNNIDTLPPSYSSNREEITLASCESDSSNITDTSGTTQETSSYRLNLSAISPTDQGSSWLTANQHRFAALSDAHSTTIDPQSINPHSAAPCTDFNANIVIHGKPEKSVYNSVLHCVSSSIIKPLISLFPIRQESGQLGRTIMRSALKVSPFFLRSSGNTVITPEAVTDHRGNPYLFKGARGKLNKQLRGEWVQSKTATTEKTTEACSESKKRDLMIYFPGGAFLSCGPETHRLLTSQLAEDIDLFVVKYRKLPDNDFTEIVNDAHRVYDFIRRKGYSDNQIYLGGDSAGGFLALSLGKQITEHHLEREQEAFSQEAFSQETPANPPHIKGNLKSSLKSNLKGIVAISPVCNLAAEGGSLEENQDRILPHHKFRQMRDLIAKRHDLSALSPLNFSLNQFPSTLITAGMNEILLDQITDFTLHAAEHKVPVGLQLWENEDHAFPVFSTQAGTEAVDAIRRFITDSSTAL